jgi:hypothetical protein
MPTEISENGRPRVKGGRRCPTSPEEEGERFGARGSTVLAVELWGAAVLAGEKLGRKRIRRRATFFFFSKLFFDSRAFILNFLILAASV